MSEGSQPTDNTRVVDITPNFVYTEDVQILRDFINDLGKAYTMTREDVEMVMNGSTSVGYFAAREAMRGVLTQDIELQIANKTFPLPKRIR